MTTRRSARAFQPLNLVLRIVTGALLAASALDGAADDSIRCRSNKLVNVGMVADQVMALCGEPKSRTAEEVPVRARTPNGNVVVTGSTRLERWTYERGYGQFDALLSFEDGKLIRIDLLTK